MTEKSGAGISLATKSKWKSPDKFFPIVVDNFFDDPETLVKYGKSLPKEVVGNQPGVRTKQFWEIDIEFHNSLIKKFLSCYYDLDYINLSWKLSNMSFHEMKRVSKDKNDIRNKGFMHQDSEVYTSEDGRGPWQNEVAGLIYLTPDIDQDSGTSLFNLKSGAIVKPIGESDPAEHREKFTEKIRFQNIFNRLIMYDACEWHAANSYWNDDGKDARLTLAFFIGGLEGTEFPLKRIKNCIYSNVR